MSPPPGHTAGPHGLWQVGTATGLHAGQQGSRQGLRVVCLSPRPLPQPLTLPERWRAQAVGMGGASGCWELGLLNACAEEPLLSAGAVPAAGSQEQVRDWTHSKSVQTGVTTWSSCPTRSEDNWTVVQTHSPQSPAVSRSHSHRAWSRPCHRCDNRPQGPDELCDLGDTPFAVGRGLGHGCGCTVQTGIGAHSPRAVCCHTHRQT